MGGTDGSSLRRAVASVIEANPDMEVAGTPLHKWLAWDSGLQPAAYAAKLRSGSWGGALEMAVVTAQHLLDIHVYEQHSGNTFKRIASFGPPGSSAAQGAAHVLYRGRVHYDALEVSV